MAGLGSMCSHVAAILFKVEACHRTGLTTDACTSQLCEWNKTFVKKIKSGPVVDMDFSKPNHNKTTRTVEPQPTKEIKEPNHSDFIAFLADVQKVNPTTVLLSVVPEFSTATEEPTPLHMPIPLTTLLYKPEYRTMSTPDFQREVDKVFLSLKITESESAGLEMFTRRQQLSDDWLEQRKGRITASTLFCVLHTDPTSPAPSLVKSICGLSSFTSKATAHGIKFEKKARKMYVKEKSTRHTKFRYSSSGLIVNPLYPHLGASPDGIISCSCCSEKGLLEVKCPYKHRMVHPVEASQIDPDFPIEFEVGNGEIIGSSLKQNHPHYTQIQCQLSICEKSYCDLMMFTFRGSIVTRVYREDNFIPKHLDRINAVYKSGILPELMTRQYRDVICDPCGPSSGTSSSSTSSSTPATQRAPLSTNVPQQAPTEAAQELFCYCRKPDDGSEEMVGCYYQNCVNQWYHLSCLTLSKAPKTKLWFCPECKSLQPPKKKRK